MQFLESDEVVNEAISVLRAELAVAEGRESKFQAEIGGIQVYMNDELASIQQRLDEVEALVRTLTMQAEESSSNSQRLKDEVNTLQKKINRAKQGIENCASDSNDPEILRTDIAKYTARKYKYESRRHDLQTEIASLEGIIQQRRDNAEPKPNPQLYDQILASYPYVLRRGLRSLEPVGRERQDLEEILQFSDYTKRLLPKSCYLPYSVGWHPPHAVVFAPTIALNQSTGSWMPFSISKGGIYRFQRIQDHKFDDIRGVHLNECLDQILDFAIPRSSPSDDWKTLQRMIIDGVLPLECMLLECLGFDEDLYDALVRQYRTRKEYFPQGRAPTDLESDRRYR